MKREVAIDIEKQVIDIAISYFNYHQASKSFMQLYNDDILSYINPTMLQRFPSLSLSHHLTNAMNSFLLFHS